MEALAVVLEKPETLAMRRVTLAAPTEADVGVDIAYSGISTGTERLLFQGRMPPFPVMGYPAVPGSDSRATVVAAGSAQQDRIGETVFVPGATCYGDVRGLFGGAASCVVIPASRAVTIDPGLGEKGVLIALAATAQHAIVGAVLPDLIVGHGVVGRLIARLILAAGGPP